MATRFWERVEKTETCWLWTGSTNWAGYGVIGEGGRDGRNLIASRASWELHNGAVPEGMVVRHNCDNPRCVRPDHLRLGSQVDNMRDKVARNRQLTGERVGNAKLSNAAVVEIRARYAAGGVTQQQLANEFGVAHTHISKIVRGETRVA